MILAPGSGNDRVVVEYINESTSTSTPAGVINAAAEKSYMGLAAGNCLNHHRL